MSFKGNKQYAVVLGKHLDISRAEIFAQGLLIEKHYNQQVAILQIPDNTNIADNIETTLNRLGGIVKRGVVIQTNQIPTTDIVGVSDRHLGNFLKKNGIAKRYKETDLLHTDEEIKTLQSEYIQLDDDLTKVVHITNYQDINRFSLIDYDKPVNSMQIGMMPAKLTQIMVNISLGKAANQSKKNQPEDTKYTPTIYDPFMGLGTTYMVGNSGGYNIIGSDINITPAKQNLPWRKEQTIAHNLPITLFAHDATQSLNKPFLQYTTCIVTEGRLGHIVTAKTRSAELQEYAMEIQKLYIAWINNMYPIRDHMTIVCSIPHHASGDNKHVTNILQHCEKKGITVETIPQVYIRSGQKVGRKIVILSW